jgi:hypothetical protein
MPMTGGMLKHAAAPGRANQNTEVNAHSSAQQRYQKLASLAARQSEMINPEMRKNSPQITLVDLRHLVGTILV